MSGLEEQLGLAVQEAGLLNQQVREFYDTQEGLINSKIEQVEAAISGLPDALVRTIYVDQVDGDDSNDGSEDNPIRTLKKAVEHYGINYGELTIYLMSDYIADAAQWYLPGGSTTILRSGGGVQRKLTLTVQPDTPASLGHVVSGFFARVSAGLVTLQVIDVHVKWPPDEQVHTMRPSNYSGLLSSFIAEGPPMLMMQIVNSTLEMPASGEGVVVGANTRCVGLVVTYATLIGSFTGRWVGGIGSNSRTADSGNVVSNLVFL